MKRTLREGRSRTPLHDGARLLAALLFAVPAPAWANPTGGQVVSGAANISGGSGTLTVNQLSNQAIIDWNGFSINVGELTRFLQPSALSAVLNRVTGGDPSALYGTLQANGSVYLINPNGITVGPTGVINAQSFAASALDVSDAQFLAGGSQLFSGSSMAGVSNAGKIDALGGSVLLVGHTVSNTGQINAPQGTAALAAGSQVLFNPAGDQHVFVQLGAGSAAVGVDQQGQIQAGTAELAAAGGIVYGVAINNSGVVRADAVENQGGRIFLTAAGGSVTNSGQLIAQNGTQGGSVQVVGDQITLAGSSLIDVSGTDGGGTVLIGGGEHGADASIPDASQVTIAAGSLIDADASVDGNGGTVIVWSNDDTEFNGAITARGGSLGGNGGFSEVSGGYLDFNGTVDLRAPNGSAGTLLLDPTDLTISDNADNNAPCGGGTCSPSGDASNLNVTTLVDQLGLGNVTVTTVGSADSGSETGNITVADAITWTSGNGLTLSAANNIIINAAINGSGTGAYLVLEAYGGTANPGAGQIQLNAAGNSGSPSISTAGGQTYNGAVIVGASTYLQDTAGGNIYFDSTLDGNGSLPSLTVNTGGSGDILFEGAVGSSNPLGTLNVTVGAAGDIDFYDPVVLGGATTLTDTNSGGSINFDSTLDGNGALPSLTINAGSGDVNFDLAVGGTAPVGVLNVNAGNISFDNTLVLGGATDLDASANSNGYVNFDGTLNGNGSLPSLTVKSGYAASAEFDDEVGNIAPLGALTVTSGSDIYFDDAVVLGGATSLTNASNSGGIYFDSTVDGFGLTFPGLSVNAGPGVVYFDAAVGGTSQLGFLDVTAATINLNGGAFNTVGNGAADANGYYGSQIYDGSVVINNGANPVLIAQKGSNGSTVNDGAITFNGTVNTDGSSESLTTTSDGNTTFSDAVGAVQALGYLDATANSGGSILINGGAVYTNAQDANENGQSYVGNVLFGGGGSVLLQATDPARGDISFSNGVLGSDDGLGENLTIDPEVFAFFDNVSGPGVYPLGSITIPNTAGNVNMDGSLLVTQGNQNYNNNYLQIGGDSVTLETLNSGSTISAGAASSYYFSIADDAGEEDQALLMTSAPGGTTGLSGNIGGELTWLDAPTGTVYYQPINGVTLEGVTDNQITTSGNQTYYLPVVLEEDTTLDAGGVGHVAFESTVEANSEKNLSVTAAGDITFDQAVGDTGPLGSLYAGAGGTIQLNGGGVTTQYVSGYSTGDQTYSSTVLLDASGGQTTLSAAGGGSITFDAAVDGAANPVVPQNLTAQTDGVITFGGEVGTTNGTLSSLIAQGYNNDGSGTTDIDTDQIVTQGDLNFDNDVLLETDSSLNAHSGGNITFEGTVEASDYQTLSANGAGYVTFDQAVGDTGNLGSLYTQATLVHLYGGTVDTAASGYSTGDQTYDANVSIDDQDANLTASGGSIEFEGTLESVSHHGLNAQAGDDVTFDQSVGDSGPFGFLYVQAGGAINLDGGVVDSYASGYPFPSSGTQEYNGSVVIGGQDAVLTSENGAGDIVFDGTIDSPGNFGLSATSAGNIYFGAPVGYTYNLGYLNAEADGGDPGSGDGRIYILGGSVTTYDSGDTGNDNGSQVYFGSVRIGEGSDSSYEGGYTFPGSVGDATLTTQGGGDVVFEGPVDSYDGYGLTVDSAGNIYFGAPVGYTYNLGYLNAEADGGSGDIYLLGGSVTTLDTGRTGLDTGTQVYDGSVSVGADATLTTNGGGDVEFQGAVSASNDHSLSVTAADDAIFDQSLGGNGTLGSLYVEAGGRIYLYSPMVTTHYASGYGTGDQTYDGNLSVGSSPGASVVLTATNGGDVTFEGTVDSFNENNLSVTAGDDVTFDEAVGGGSVLGSIYVSAGNVINLYGGTVNTRYASGYETGNQTYAGDVSMERQDTFLTANGGSITFQGDVESPANYGLTLDAGQNVTLGGPVGDADTLGYLDVQAGGKIDLNGGAVDTYASGYPYPTESGDQDYDGAVSVGADADLVSTNGGDITFEATVDDPGGHALTVSAANDVTFDEAVGGSVPLGSLTVSAGGAINVDGGSVATTGGQTYNEAVTLGDDADFTTTGGGVVFSGGVDGAGNALSVDAHGGDVTWDGAVSGSDILLQGADLVMDGDVDSSGSSGVLMVAGDSFTNAASHAIDLSGGGDFLIYSVKPSLDDLGGLSGPYQYDTAYPAPADFSGSGFLFSSAAPGSGFPPFALKTFSTTGAIYSFDISEPSAQSHDGGYLSDIETPDFTDLYRARHKKKPAVDGSHAPGNHGAAGSN